MICCVITDSGMVDLEGDEISSDPLVLYVIQITGAYGTT